MKTVVFKNYLFLHILPFEVTFYRSGWPWLNCQCLLCYFWTLNFWTALTYFYLSILGMTTLLNRSAHQFKLNDILFYIFQSFHFLFKTRINFWAWSLCLWKETQYIFAALRVQVYILRPANFRWRSNWFTTVRGGEIGKVAPNEMESGVNWICCSLQIKWNIL